MRKMMIVSVLLVAMLVSAGCATLSLPEGADSAAKKAALCSDARIALEMADAALAGEQLDEEAVRYYRISKILAEIGIRNYCVEAAK